MARMNRAPRHVPNDAVVSVEDLLRLLQAAAGRDPNFRPIMKIGHDLKANVAPRVGDHSYDRADALSLHNCMMCSR